MSFEVKATEHFEKRLKRLSKKYQSLLDDLSGIINELSDNPRIGTPIGKDCYKVRIAVRSKGKGKSGGSKINYLYPLLKKHCFPDRYL